MIPTRTTILQRFTDEWAIRLQPEAILTVCREIEYTAWRDRVLTPGGILSSAGQTPLALLSLRILERFGSAVQRSALDDGRWQSHRTFLVDGSGYSMPDTPTLQDAFGQPTEQRPECGFPGARQLGRFHAGTGVLLKLVVAPRLTHDLARVQAVHPSLQPGDILVADRGLCSYVHRALLVQASVHAVLRVGARQIADFSPGRRVSGRVCGGTAVIGTHDPPDSKC